MYIRKRARQRRMLLIPVVVLAVMIYAFFSHFGDDFIKTVKSSVILKSYNAAVEFCMPQLMCCEPGEESMPCRDIVAAVVPIFSYHSRLLWYDSQLEGQAGYENLAVRENEQWEAMLAENDGQQPAGRGTQDDSGNAKEAAEGSSAESGSSSGGQEPVSLEKPEKQVTIKRQKLTDFDYLIQNFYQVDSTTTITSKELNANKLLKENLTLQDTEGDEPQILIYHTHSQEGYKDSVAGDPSTTVVGVGEYLTKLLTEQYGYKVLHHTGEYDVGDREHAYSNAAPAVEEILAEHPSIQVVIDLHRDGVAETTHLVTELNGKQTAQIMFFNGLSRTTTIGDIAWLPNPYIQNNLAFSFQMQLAAAEYYPGLTRRIYLKGYRYNMHYCPHSLLVEVGAQNNTLEEAMNAMEPLAVLLDEVLSGD